MKWWYDETLKAERSAVEMMWDWSSTKPVLLVFVASDVRESALLYCLGHRQGSSR